MCRYRANEAFKENRSWLAFGNGSIAALTGSGLQPNVIKLSNIKKHFIVAQASCLCEIQAGCLYHHVKIHKGDTFSLNLMTLACSLNPPGVLCNIMRTNLGCYVCNLK